MHQCAFNVLADFWRQCRTGATRLTGQSSCRAFSKPKRVRGAHRPRESRPRGISTAACLVHTSRPTVPPGGLNCTHTLITLVASVFRSLRTTVRSARRYKRYSTDLPLLRLLVATPGHRPSELPALVASYCTPSRHRTPLHHLGLLACPLRVSSDRDSKASRLPVMRFFVP